MCVNTVTIQLHGGYLFILYAEKCIDSICPQRYFDILGMHFHLAMPTMLRDMVLSIFSADLPLIHFRLNNNNNKQEKDIVSHSNGFLRNQLMK